MKKVFKAVFVLLLAVCVLSFAACGQKEISAIYINGEGHIIIEYSDGTYLDGGETPNASNSTQRSVSKALLSSVSVYSDTSAGSGVIYKLDKAEGNAYIITNYHVIYDADKGLSTKFSVMIYGQEFSDYIIDATYVGGSMTYDIALLRIDNSEIIKNSDCLEATVGNSNEVVPGVFAIAVGNPKGEGISATYGIVNVDSEQITMTGADDKTVLDFRVMRVDTPVNSGNSGGGLFDGEGNLIGIVNAKTKDLSIENIGYAIPSNVALNVASNILYNYLNSGLQQVQKCLLGVTVLGSPRKAVYNEQSGKTEIVEQVTVKETSLGSLSYENFYVDDIIISGTLGGHTVTFTRSFHIVDFMLLVNNGDTVTFKVLRGGKEEEVVITIPQGHAKPII